VPALTEGVEVAGAAERAAVPAVTEGAEIAASAERAAVPAVTEGADVAAAAERAAAPAAAEGADAAAAAERSAVPAVAEREAAAAAAPTNTLEEELQAFRQTLPPRTPTSGGTAGVARTDLPGLEARTFRGASPNAGGPMEAGGTIRSPNPSPRFQLHAEEDLANQIDRAIQEAALTPEQMAGRTVNMHIEQRVCNICRQGLGGTDVPAGVLKQLSDKYPNITFNVSAEGTSEVLGFRGGRYLD
jgi:hypothetical protein